MKNWHRIFGTELTPPDPETVLSLARRFFPKTEMRLETVAQGWARLELWLAPGLMLAIERYRREEEGIRGELQAWATAIEERIENPEQETLLRQVATAQQIITLGGEATPEKVLPLAFALCRHLASVTSGVFHIDGRGYFDAAGIPLLAEET
jgi:hypothetical protein